MSRSRSGALPGVVAALPPEVRRLIPTMEDTLDIPRGRWVRVPALAQLLEAVAVAHIAREYELEGHSRTTARRMAAVRCGLDPDTVKRRLERWRRGTMAEGKTGDNLSSLERSRGW